MKIALGFGHSKWKAEMWQTFFLEMVGHAQNMTVTSIISAVAMSGEVADSHRTDRTDRTALRYA